MRFGNKYTHEENRAPVLPWMTKLLVIEWPNCCEASSSTKMERKISLLAVASVARRDAVLLWLGCRRMQRFPTTLRNCMSAWLACCDDAGSTMRWNHQKHICEKPGSSNGIFKILAVVQWFFIHETLTLTVSCCQKKCSFFSSSSRAWFSRWHLSLAFSRGVAETLRLWSRATFLVQESSCLSSNIDQAET